MKKIADRTIAIRKALGMTQREFAEQVGISRAYLSVIETGDKVPSQEVVDKLVLLESSLNASQIARQSASHNATYSGSVKEQSNVQSAFLITRKIPVYTFVQAGQATAYEGLPTSWDDTIDYDGTDEKAFALRVTGDSMSPRFEPGVVITVSPKYPPHNGQLVVAKIKEEGCVFKLFHHNGDGRIVTLSSYNPLYKDIVLPREKLHWLYRVVRSTQNL